MSDERIPDLVLTARLPRLSATKRSKSVNIKLYLASQFRSAWSANLKDKFFPKPPLRKADSDEFWGKEIYRVKLNDKWHGTAKYTFFSWEEITGLIRRGE